MTLDLPTWAAWLAVGVPVLVLVAAVVAVVLWLHPATTWVVRPVLRGAWGIIAGSVVLALGALALLVMWRRRRPGDPEAGPVDMPDAEDLHEARVGAAVAGRRADEAEITLAEAGVDVRALRAKTLALRDEADRAQ